MAQQLVFLNVEGMSCTHCSGMVQKTLENINGISKISVNLEGKKASFETTDDSLVEKAIKEVTDAGYKASPA